MTETALVVVNAQNAVQVFTGGGLDSLLAEIEAKVRAIPLDPSTAKGLAAKKERARIELEQAESAEAQRKREANEKLRAKVRAEIVADVMQATEETHSDTSIPQQLADALMSGKIRNCKVVF